VHDRVTEGHSIRVTEMTVRLGREMEMNEVDLLQVQRGALLHGIGKMGIPDHILLKPGVLADEEWEIMRKHPRPARIFAVVDVWDGLISDRRYHPAWTKEQALAHIQEQSGKHFDPGLTDKFLCMKELVGN
jgi:HD-GYP domain-containing protein (c-di-GMP phosphodiesterase class II)